MRSIYDIKENLHWIDILSPSPLDLQYLRQNYNFHSVILDELLHLSSRGKVDRFEDDYLYIVFRIPVYDIKEKTSKCGEIDLLITRNSLITVHYQPLQPIEEFERKLKNKKLIEEINDTARLTYQFLEEVNQFSLHQLQRIQEKVNQVGEQLFAKHQQDLLERISWIKRDLVTIGMIVQPQLRILESLLSVCSDFWGKRAEVYFSDLLNDYGRVINLFESLKTTLSDFETTNAQLLNYKSNDVMKKFTVLAFLTFPLMLVVAIITIPTISEAIENWMGLNGFILLILGSVLTMGLLAYIFRKKDWM